MRYLFKASDAVRGNRPKWVAIATLLLFFLPQHSLAYSASSDGDGSAGEGLAKLRTYCSGCHAETTAGKFSRISNIRKTVDGWGMTLTRMGIWHGVKVPPEDRRMITKYLADHYGLAPAETEGYRYILEQRPHQVEEHPDKQFGDMCARCHSYARFALQRRDAEEWRKLVHTHVGQIVMLEYQGSSRPINWWDVATQVLPGKLEEAFPYRMDAWQDWVMKEKPEVAGEWVVKGESEGGKRFTGVVKVTPVTDEDDQYKTQYSLEYADGRLAKGAGRATVYTGFEWRGSNRIGEKSRREVFQVAEDGNSWKGRWYIEGQSELGADIHAVRADKKVKVVAVEPPYLKVGEKNTITIKGANLSREIELGDGVSVKEIVSGNRGSVVATVEVDAKASLGSRTVSVKGAEFKGLLNIYKNVDRIVVQPRMALSRVGGGAMKPVTAQFKALAYINGEDGLPNTTDDVCLGSMPVDWSIDNYDEIAAELKDKQFAGTIDSNGLFTPAKGGPNPKRKFSNNNTGNLKVGATLDNQGGKQVKGEAQLIVTVQKWNIPPIQ